MEGRMFSTNYEGAYQQNFREAIKTRDIKRARELLMSLPAPLRDVDKIDYYKTRAESALAIVDLEFSEIVRATGESVAIRKLEQELEAYRGLGSPENLREELKFLGGYRKNCQSVEELKRDMERLDAYLEIDRDKNPKKLAEKIREAEESRELAEALRRA